MTILHGITGSVASRVLYHFSQQYDLKHFESRLIQTENSKKFAPDFYSFRECYSDEDEWSNYKHNQTVLHIDLVKWADVFVIAPCSANTLAKIANGICDNLLTCCARAWDFKKQFIIAPAMNTRMWNHPITKEHLDKIASWGINIQQPVEKKLFCGDYGIGAMADVCDIIQNINPLL